MKTPRIVVSTIVGMLFCATASASLKVTFNEMRTRATFAFDSSDRERKLFLAYGSSDGGRDLNDWELVRQVGVVPSGCTSLPDVVLPDDFAVSGRVARAFLNGVRLTSTDYVQKGLALQYDAIDNAGRGQHADAPTAWVDLVGGKNLPLVVEGAEADTASADYMYIGSTEHNAGSIFAAYCNMTMEAGFAVTAFHKAGKDTEVYFRIPMLGGICCDTRDNNRAFQFRKGGYVTWAYSAYANLAAFSASGNYAYCSLRCGNYTVDSTDTTFAFIDGAGRERSSEYWTGSDPEGLFLTVGNIDGAAKVRSLRIYNRTLTDDEQRWNYAVDRARFEGDFGETVLFAEATPFARLNPKGFVLSFR